MNYSQSNEQEHILKYFDGFVGRFCSVGENDGTTFSNVRALAMAGWSGVAIEPEPNAFAKLKELYKDRKDIYTYNYAISKNNGKAILHASGPLCSAADVGLVSTFHAHEKARFDRTVKYDPIEVITYRWKTAINRWKIKEFEFISLDVESDELNILPYINLEKTRCICIEWNSKPELKTEYEKYLDGFKVIYTSAENLIYAR